MKPGRKTDIKPDSTDLSSSLANSNYLSLASRALVSLNSSAAVLDSKDYLKSPSPPHIYQLVSDAYFHMRRNQDDHSIILIGESASGKSHAARLVAKHLCYLSKLSKKKSRVQSNILKVDSVFSAFGDAWGLQNMNASNIAKYIEYQFDVAGKLVGAKFIDFFFNKNTLTNIETPSFHIFYYLVAGSSIDERQKLHLSDRPDHYYYLSRNRPITTEDSQQFAQLRENLKSLGIGRRQQAQLFQLLAAILQLGNINFMDNGNENNEECIVKNYPQLELAANLLGLSPQDLENTLTTRTKLVKKDLISVLLDVRGAEEQRDALARCLYSVVFTWIMEQINHKLCRDENDWQNFIAVLDFPGSNNVEDAEFCDLMVNYVNDKVLAFAKDQVRDVELLVDEGIQADPPQFSSIHSLALLEGNQDDLGLLSLINTESAKATKSSKIAEKIYESFGNTPSFSPAKKPKYAFRINHPSGSVEYDTRSFESQNMDTLQSDFVALIRGTLEQQGTASGFIRSLFSDKLIATQTHAGDQSTVVAATSKNVRFPSMKRRGHKESSATATVATQLQSSLGEILDCMRDTKTWFGFHIRPSDRFLQSTVFDHFAVSRQTQEFDLEVFAECPSLKFSMTPLFGDFVNRYAPLFSFTVNQSTSIEDKIRTFAEEKGWSATEAVIGRNRVLLTESVWQGLEQGLKDLESPPKVPKTGLETQSTYSESDFGDDTASIYSEAESHYSSEFEFDDNKKTRGKDVETGQFLEKGSTSSTLVDGPKEDEDIDEKPKMSKLRWRWLCCVWCVTGYVPPFCLRICGNMKRKDQQIAWREKVTLCFIIFLMCSFILFFIAGLGLIVCPKRKELSSGEMPDRGRSKIDGRPTVYMYGEYFQIPEIVRKHIDSGLESNRAKWEDSILAQDVSQMFPKERFWNTYCPAFSPPAGFRLFASPNEFIADGTWVAHDFYGDFLPRMRFYRVGQVVWDLETMRKFVDKTGPYSNLIVAYDRVYDVSSFFTETYKDMFLGDSVRVRETIRNLFNQYGKRAGYDSTPTFNVIRSAAPQDWANIMRCMDGLFLVGFVDHRQDLKCVVPNYILLASSAILVAVIGFKFLAALQLTGKRQPEDHDKFVICQVPCYTEGEVSLTRTVNSLAGLAYDDKHKLIFVIADGMIIGSGNDRPTPRIVLDIFGVDQSVDPVAFSFESLGDGNKQHNMGKIYSGLYEIQGRAVPFIVVVKVGKPSERQRPGNRGKRDSQMLLMRFLSRVHFNQEMSPLELELYHQMKNVIGVDPAFYEYVLMVDADTEVYKDSLNRMVSSMTRDAKIMGICGETQIANERDSWVTMIQVYEYFISHHLAKAFESLFGSVTCLPGCFCMYRIRTSIKNVPLLVAPSVIQDYSENSVGTLHMKNLLHLGEDRYLTTLMMKHFPQMKLTFIGDAKCKTYCPDKWSVILSQRRRWINSTVHNLLELVFLPELCGFCCFSMRFVVFIDLFATVVQPAALMYVGFLVYLSITDENLNFPLISIIMIAAIYGFQVIIFLLKRQWEHIGWMCLYIFAIPIFSFYLPIYSFWHFDDFSWGNTRRVVGDKKKKQYVADVDQFDPASIPLRKWADYEQEVLERQDTASLYSGAPDNMSYYSGRKGVASAYGSQYEGSAYGGSVYGGSTYSASAYIPAPTADMRLSYYGSSEPTDEAIMAQVQKFLKTADLMTVTKKKVREELSRVFGVDLSARKEYIHECIDVVLKGDV